MKRLLIAGIALAIVAAGVAAIAVLLYSEAALNWVFARIEGHVPGQLTVRRLEGRLAGPLAFTDLHYEDGAVTIRAERIVLRWRPAQLLEGRLAIEALELAAVDVTIKPAPERAAGSAFRFALPLPVEIGQFSAGPLTLHRAGHAPVTADTLSFRAAARGESVNVSEFKLASSLLSLAAGGKMSLNATGPLDLEVRWRAQAREQAIVGSGTINGSLQRLVSDMKIVEPIELTLTSELDTTEEAPRWRLHGAAAPFDLTALMPQAPPARISGTVLQASGSGSQLAAEGAFSWNDAHYGRWAVALSTERDGDLWQLPHFQLKSLDRGTDITGQARAELGADGVQNYSVDARWRGLSWPPVQPARIDSPQGTLTLKGDPSRYTFTLQGTLLPPATPALDLALSGHGDRTGMVIETLSGNWIDGGWSGRGSLSWSPAWRWILALDARHVNPAALMAGFDGNLDANARIEGGYAPAGLSLGIDVDRLEGTMRGHPVRGRTRVVFQGGEIAVDDLQLSSGAATLAADARFGREWRLDWQADAPELADLLSGIDGALRTQGRISGPRNALRTQFELEARNFAYRGSHADAVELRADVDMAPAGRWQVFARADGTGLREQDRGRVLIEGDGSSQEHGLRLSWEQDDYRIEQRLTGSWSGQQWRARLHDGRLDLAALGPFTQQGSSDLALSTDAIELGRTCWGQDLAALCVDAGGRPTAALQANLEWRQLDLARVQALLPPSEIGLTGTSGGTLRFSTAAGLPQELNLNLGIEAGAVSAPLPLDTTQRHRLAYRQAGLVVAANGGNGLRADIRIDLDAGERLDATLRLPRWDIATREFSPAQPLAGDIALDLTDLGAISLFFPELVPGPGRLEARATLAGTLGDPRIDGQLDLGLSTLALTRLGINLRDVVLNARSEQNRWRLQGALRSGEGRLEIDGSGALHDIRRWDARLGLSGEQVEIIRLPAAAIIASPDITLYLLPGELAFEGTLAVPAARLEPATMETGVVVSEDVVIIGGDAPATAAPHFRIHGDLDLILGNDVRVAGRGLDGRLTGRLRIRMNAPDDINGQGEIRFVEGRYRAYGQNLSIEQGRVLYAGGVIDDPALDIVATRQRGEAIKVGVRVTGTASQPVVQLFSDPLMDEGDILSYLVLGRPLNQASASEGQALYQAATSIALVGGEALASRIAGIFDITEVSIEAGETDVDTALVLGKSLSPRLHVRYIQGLVENTTAFQIRYRLSDKWTLETESGTRSGTGADLIYNLER